MSVADVIADKAEALIEVGGVEVAAHFGDPEGEYGAARQDAALAHRFHRTLVRISGEDRVRFLHGLLSNSVENLAAGEGRPALFLDTKGHVRGLLDLWAEDDAIVVGCERGFAESSLSDLCKYVLGADVRIEERGAEVTVVALLGPRATDCLRATGAEVPADAPRAHRRTSVAGTPVRLARTPDLGAPGYEIHVATTAVDEVWSALEQASPSPVYIGWEAAEALRIEAGVPRLGHEINGEEFPQEIRLDDAVDFDKGCYLGQETVARIHYRGRVNRLLSGLNAADPLPVGAELVLSERRIGRVTSAGHSPRFGSVGLGYVRREEAESLASVEAHHDDRRVASVRVVALPFDA